MTLPSGAAADCLWQPGAVIVSDCWNGYSPSSSLSSLPCSPGPTGGLVCHAEKNACEQVTMSFAQQDICYKSKRIRLHEGITAGACLQGYNHLEGVPGASTQKLALSITSSPQACGIYPLLRPSGHLATFQQSSAICVGGSAPMSGGQASHSSGTESVFSISQSNIPLGFNAPTRAHFGGSLGTGTVEQRPSLPSWQAQQPLAAILPAQAAPAFSSAINSLAFTLALCDVHTSQQLVASAGLPAPGAAHASAAAVSGCAPTVAGFSLPFVFRGAVPGPVPAVAPAGVPLAAQPQAIPLSMQPLPCGFPSSLPSVMPSVMLDPIASTVRSSDACITGNGMDIAGHRLGLYGTLTLAAGTASTAAAADPQMSVVPQLQLQLSLPQLPQLPQQHERLAMMAPPMAAVVQVVTPCLNSLPERVRCTALVHQPQPQAQLQPQPPSQVQTRQPPNLPRVRPPSPSPPSTPPTPLQPGSLGPEDWILHAVKVLDMTEPDTARLALHCWRQVSELPQLHHAARLWPSAAAGRSLYATACLWVSIKLEEKRRAVPGGVLLAHLAATTPAALCSAELAVMNWLEWRPYDGYRLDESHLLVYM